MDKYARPSILTNLVMPLTNESVYSRMKKGTQVADLQAQKIQDVLKKAIIPATRMMSDISSKEGENKPLHSCFESIADIVRLGTAAFWMLSKVRKEIIRNDLQYPMNILCTWKTPVSQEMLFGEDTVKRLKDKREETRKIHNTGVNKNNLRSYKQG